MSNPETKVPFECLVRADAIPALGRTYKLMAHRSALNEIAHRIGVLEIGVLSGKLSAKPNKSGMTVIGDVHSLLKRTCVSTLKQVDEEINEHFKIRYSSQFTDALDTSDNDDEDIEPLVIDQPVDLADLLVQQVALAMSPYPKVPGVEDLAQEFGLDREKSPFNVLKQLKNDN